MSYVLGHLSEHIWRKENRERVPKVGKHIVGRERRIMESNMGPIIKPSMIWVTSGSML